MPLPTDEKILALSNEMIHTFDYNLRTPPRLSPRPRQGRHAHRNLYAFA